MRRIARGSPLKVAPLSVRESERYCRLNMFMPHVTHVGRRRFHMHGPRFDQCALRPARNAAWPSSIALISTRLETDVPSSSLSQIVASSWRMAYSLPYGRRPEVE